MIRYKKIKENESLERAIKIISEGNINTLIIVNQKDIVKGIFTQGDFRDTIIKKKNFLIKIKSVCNKKFKFLQNNSDKKKIVAFFKKNKKVVDLPILNKQKKLVTVVNRFSYLKDRKAMSRFFSIIMAGGKGTRLQNFSDLFPKALVPVDGEPLLKKIIDKINYFGISDIRISVNYKKELLKVYIKSNRPKDTKIKFIEENKFLGTVGCLKLLKNEKKKHFLMTNCDLIIDSDYNDFFNFHLKNKNFMTVISAYQSFSKPYGICEINKHGLVKNIIEKPIESKLVSTGMYIIDKKAINLLSKIKKDFINMDEFIKLLISENKKVMAYPIDESSWKDYGRIETITKNLR